jgi:hypothetical protein
MTWHVSRRARRMLLWSGWVVIALTSLPVLDGPVFGVAVPASALALALVPGTPNLPIANWRGEAKAHPSPE